MTKPHTDPKQNQNTLLMHDKPYPQQKHNSGGELLFHLARRRRFPEATARFYAAELVLALEYLHAHDIVFRDLKVRGWNGWMDGWMDGWAETGVFIWAYIIHNTCRTTNTPLYLLPPPKPNFTAREHPPRRAGPLAAGRLRPRQVRRAAARRRRGLDVRHARVHGGACSWIDSIGLIYICIYVYVCVCLCLAAAFVFSYTCMHECISHVSHITQYRHNHKQTPTFFTAGSPFPAALRQVRRYVNQTTAWVCMRVIDTYVYT